MMKTKKPKTKISLQLLFLFTVLVSCNTNKNNIDEGYSINGTIEGVANGKAILAKLDLVTNERVDVDSTEIKNGKFKFYGSLESPYVHTLLINKKSNIHFFLENSNIDIKANINEIENVKIIGSREDSLFRSYKTDDIFERKKGMEIMLKYPDYSFAAFTAYYQFQLYNIHLDTLDIIVNNFKEHVTKSEYYKHLKKLLPSIKRVAISQPAPEFSIPNTEQKLMSLNEFKGKYVLIDFWASWCAPCRATNLELVKIYNRFSNNDFTIIGISVDKDRDRWLNAIKTDKLSWTNLSNLKGWDKVSTAYGVKAVPQNFLIDPTGIIIDKNIEPEDLVEKLENIFSNKKRKS